MKSIKIYQLPTSNEFCFIDYTMLHKHGGSINFDEYKLIYTGLRNDAYTEDDAFTEFNIAHPKEYIGRSLSVSDIVEIDGKKLYCDSIGWVKVS